MKILLVGYYHYEDGYYSLGKTLEELGHDIAFFPLIEFVRKEGSIKDLINIINGVNLLEKTYCAYMNNTPINACDVCVEI